MINRLATGIAFTGGCLLSATLCLPAILPRGGRMVLAAVLSLAVAAIAWAGELSGFTLRSAARIRHLSPERIRG